MKRQILTAVAAVFAAAAFLVPAKILAQQATTSLTGTVTDTKNSILRLVRAHEGESGIVYCLSRRSVESMAEFLSGRGVKAPSRVDSPASVRNNR